MTIRRRIEMLSNKGLRVKPRSLADLREEMAQIQKKILERARASVKAAEELDPQLATEHRQPILADAGLAVELVELFHDIWRFIPEFEQRVKNDAVAQTLERIEAADHLKQSVVAKAVNADHQTGLYNKSYMEWTLLPDFIREVAKTERRKDAMAALWMLDLDKLKLINDSHHFGYQVGDAIITYLAYLLYSHIKPGKLASYLPPDGHGFNELVSPGRVGGDEFMVLERSIRNQDATFQLAKEIKKIYETNDWSVLEPPDVMKHLAYLESMARFRAHLTEHHYEDHPSADTREETDRAFNYATDGRLNIDYFRPKVSIGITILLLPSLYGHADQANRIAEELRAHAQKAMRYAKERQLDVPCVRGLAYKDGRLQPTKLPEFRRLEIVKATRTS